MADIEKRNPTDLIAPELINDLRQIIDSARSRVAVTANYELTAMYWHIGNRINNEVLGNERAEYGKQIVSQVATQLQEEYGGKGFERRNIHRMMQFAQLFPDFQIVSQLATKLSWSHFIEVLPLKEPLQREFYLTMAANERWSKSNSFSWINRVSVWRNTSPNCHPRKFFCVNCKNPLRRQKRIIPPTDERNTKREKKSKKEQAEKEDDAEERVVRVF